MLMEKTETTGRTSESEPEIEVNSNYGEGDCEDSQKEIDRFNTLKKSKSLFMETLEVKPKKVKKEPDSIETRMTILLKAAEQ
jgi:hypothetical protein